MNQQETQEVKGLIAVEVRRVVKEEIAKLKEKKPETKLEKVDKKK
jgi:hypothetical protein